MLGFLALLTFAIVFLVLYIVYKPPTFVISQLQQRWPDVLWSVDTDEKIIALTIDDAPSEYTLAIAETLAEYDAHATFFVIGAQVHGREDILADLVRRGHELGNHAMKDEPSRSLPERTLVDQIHEVEAMIVKAYQKGKAGSKAPRYFRPGSGFFSDKMREMAQRIGYKIVLGNIYPHDPQIHSWRVNANHILSMLKPGGIIICHDRRSWTLPMLQSVLPAIKAKGYRIVSISELLKVAKIET
jgi:peptidoglycan/xylan/chitin deacetylase (PgdA/CDA1 family)